MNTRILFHLLVICLFSFGMLTGCKRKQKTEPSVLPAPLPALATTPEEAVAEVNRALDLWTFKRGQPPKDLNELVTAGFLQRLPVAPAGKKFAFDPAKMRVQLVAE